MAEKTEIVEPEQGQPEQQPAFTEEQQEIISKMIQSETDRVRNDVHDKYKGKLSAKEQELEELRKEKMSEKEKLEYELEQERKRIKQEKQELERERLKFHAVNKITELGLDKDVIDILDFDNASQDVIDLKLEKLSKLVQGVKQNTTNDFIKQHGTKPSSGSPLNMPAKTWEDLSVEEATKLKRENPEAYNRLRAARKR